MAKQTSYVPSVGRQLDMMVWDLLTEAVKETNPTMSKRARAHRVKELVAGLSLEDAVAFAVEALRH